MAKLMNDASTYVDEALEGLCAAFPGYRRTGHGNRVIATAAGQPRGRVGVATGGGFGHLPLFAGYVGKGLLSACAVGDVFAGPSKAICLDALRAADGGAGIVCVLGNYGGDRMSFAAACDQLDVERTPTRTVIVTDDIASAAPEQKDKRRGVAGAVFAFKIAGASAARGDTLDQVHAISMRAAEQTRSIGIALSPCTIPGADAPGFSIPEGTVALGMGIHGEPGIDEQALQPADSLASEMIRRLLSERTAHGNGKVAVLVNSLGATPFEELAIVYRKVRELLDKAGLEVRQRFVGHYATSMEMAGCSISLLDLDEDLEALLSAPTDCPFWPRVA